MSKRARILVVDDDPLLRSVIVTMLQKQYTVVVASEGSEGYYLALEQPPDLIVLDIQMPGWDGFRTLKTFRSHPSLQHVKIVMLTSDASKETILAAINGGADDYLIKTSFSKDEFLEKVDRLLPESPTEQAGVDVDSELQSARHPSSKERSSSAHGTSESHSKEVEASSAEDTDPHDVYDAALQEVIDSWE